MSTLSRNDDGLRRTTAGSTSESGGRFPGSATAAALASAVAVTGLDGARSGDAGAPTLKSEDGRVSLAPGAGDPLPALADLVDRLIEHFDADADGAISAEELAIAVDASGRFGDLVSRLASHGMILDGDADGLITADELTSALADTDPHLLPAPRPKQEFKGPGRDGDGPGGHTGDDGSAGTREPVSVADAAAALFADADTDHDAALTLTEVLSLVDTQPTTIPFDALVGKVFARMDLDADQQLTLIEVSTALGQADANGDGLLAGHELPGHPFDQLSVELIGLLVHKLMEVDAQGGPGA